MKILIKYALFLVMTCAIGCADDCQSCEPIFSNNQLEFTNLGQPHIQLFQVDSVAVNGAPGDTTHRQYILKEHISEGFDQSGAIKQFRIERERSADGGLSFTPLSGGRYEVIGNDVIRTIGNLPFQILDLPAIVNSTWNGASYFSQPTEPLLINGEPIDVFKGDWLSSFEITTFSNSEDVEGVRYDSVITITHVDVDALTERRYSIEKYAWKVGLVYREMQFFDELCDQVGDPCKNDLPWINRANRGFYLKQWRIN